MQPESQFAYPVFLSACRCCTGLILCIVAGTGCIPASAPPAPPRAFEGKALRIAVPDNAGVRTLLARHGNVWSEDTGGKLELVASSDTRVDLVVFRTPELPRLIRAEQVAPLPDSIANIPGYEFTSFLAPYRFHLTEWQRKNHAVPLVGDALVCVYRADLLESANHRTVIDARLKHPLRSTGPTTWQEFAAIAEHFAMTASWSANDAAVTLVAGRRPSLPALPTEPIALAHEFHVVAASFVQRAMKEELVITLREEQRRQALYNYHFDVNTGEPRIADPGFVAALELMQRLQACRDVVPSEGIAASFRLGRAMLALAPLSELKALQQLEGAGGMKIGVCRVPGSAVYFDRNKSTTVGDIEGNYVPYLGAGGWLIGLTPTTQYAEAALDLLTFLTGPPTSFEVVYEPTWGSGPTRITHLHLTHRAGWFNYGLSETQTNQLLQALGTTFNPTTVNPVYCLRLPDASTYETALAVELQAALQGKKTPPAALRDAARQWDQIGGPAARERRKQDYRLSVGLN